MASTPPVPRAYDAAEDVDHVRAADRLLRDGESELAQVHALLAIAESVRGAPATSEFTHACELPSGRELADGSMVISVEEANYDQPNTVYITVTRAGEIYRLALLRTTPIALAPKG